jgi:two-component system, OmpR family, response regulator CpxR
MESILVIDDDVEMCGMLAEYLQSEGLQVETVHDGEDGLKRALSAEHSLILLDVMLPKINGIELLRRLRTESNARVLLLTARGEELDRIIGLEVGADDYVPKPFSARELLARIRAILRRPETGSAANSRGPWRVALGDVEMDKGTRTVRRAGSDVELTALEFNLLELLLRMAGQVVTRERVATAILGRQFSPFDRSIDVHVNSVANWARSLRGRNASSPSGVSGISIPRK